jgi:hypothetical protein
MKKETKKSRKNNASSLSLWLAQLSLSSFAVAKQNQSKDDCYSF